MGMWLFWLKLSETSEHSHHWDGLVYAFGCFVGSCCAVLCLFGWCPLIASPYPWLVGVQFTKQCLFELILLWILLTLCTFVRWLNNSESYKCVDPQHDRQFFLSDDKSSISRFTGNSDKKTQPSRSHSFQERSNRKYKTPEGRTSGAVSNFTVKKIGKSGSHFWKYVSHCQRFVESGGKFRSAKIAKNMLKFLCDY